MADLLLQEPGAAARFTTVGSKLQDWGVIWGVQYAKQLGTLNEYLRGLPPQLFKSYTLDAVPWIAFIAPGPLKESVHPPPFLSH